MVICKEIDDYIKYAEVHPKWINKKRKLLIKNIVKPTLKRNDVFFDEKTYRNCLQYCKSNFYELFPFQKFIYAFAFMYKDDIPVFSKFFIKEGRGNGKDGFIVPLVNFFQTPLYGVKNYHVEIVANSEGQVKDTFKVAYDMLHDNPKFSNITLTCAGHNYPIYKKKRSSEVIHLKYDNARIRLYLQNVVGQYDRTLDAVNAMMRMSSMPRFKLKLGTSALSFREKQADGTDKVMTKDQYVKKIKALLESDELAVLTESDNVAIDQLQINTATKAEELAKMALQINNEVANAFDIPEAVFNGNITEKSDATNEFITYAVGPVAEVINDTLTAYIVGENDYCTKNEKVMVWLARFKHVDVVDSATNLDKLRGIGFNYDELREMVGYTVLNTEFSQARALTKNYGEEGSGNAT